MRQRCDPTLDFASELVGPAKLGPSPESPPDTSEQGIVAERLLQEIEGTSFHCADCRIDICILRQKDDWQGDFSTFDFFLKCQPAHPRQPNFQQEATGS